MTIKNLTFAAFALMATLAMTTSGQVKSVAAANSQPLSKPPSASQNPASATRVRVLGQGSSAPASNMNSSATLQTRAKPDFNDHAAAPRRNTKGVAAATSRLRAINLKPDVSSNTTASSSNAASASAVAATSSQIYRVGIRDVLDIQLTNNPSKQSTLFTVLDGGLLEYPLAGNPIPVAGLTATEIAALLRQRIKIFENPAVAVSVRDYASHTVSVTGFVAAPGTKTLRREAVPLYAILAEALVFPDAARATITRQGRAPIIVDLKDTNLSSMLVIPGDAIKVSGLPPGPTEFFFIGGGIKSPGEKPYHAGLTLTQAILASGGTSVGAGSRIRVARQGTDGRLVSEEYNLKKIQTGKIPDPVLQKGDRIEVSPAN